MRSFEPASKLIDRRVDDASGAFVGRVAELLVDAERGQIEYVLIALETGRVKDFQQVTVPWSIVRADSRRGDRWTLTVTQRALENLATGLVGPRAFAGGLRRG